MFFFASAVSTAFRSSRPIKCSTCLKTKLYSIEMFRNFVFSPIVRPKVGTASISNRGLFLEWKAIYGRKLKLHMRNEKAFSSDPCCFSNKMVVWWKGIERKTSNEDDEAKWRERKNLGIVLFRNGSPVSQFNFEGTQPPSMGKKFNFISKMSLNIHWNFCNFLTKGNNTLWEWNL